MNREGGGGRNEIIANVAFAAGSLEPLSVCRADDMVKGRKECWATTEREGGWLQECGAVPLWRDSPP